MLYPPTIMRFAIYAGIALLVRGIIREARAERQGVPMLPPASPAPRRIKSASRRKPRASEDWDEVDEADEVPASDPPAR